MTRVVPVADAGDERLADYLQLTEAQLRRDGEVFLCEGVLVIRRAIALGTRLRSLLVTPERLGTLADALEPLDVPVYVVEQALMSDITGFNIHRGAIAAATRPVAPLPEDLLATATTVAVLEGVNDAENLGALFRNAAAFGTGAVLLDPTCIDPLYRRAVRVSMGHVLGVPHARLEPWPEALDRVRDAGFEIVALTPDHSAVPIETMARGGRVALLLGAEGPGLSPAALSAADRRMHIPMAAGVDSLNVATAAAIAFHHRFTGAVTRAQLCDARRMELRHVLRTTPASRTFTDEPVGDDVLYELLDTARFAPSGGNRQGWRVLIVVRDPAIRRQLRDLYVLAWREYAAHVRAGLVPFAPAADGCWRAPAVDLEAARETPAPNEFADHLDTVPVLLVLVADLTALAVLDNGLGRQSIVGGASVYPFAHNLLLAASDVGLGGVLTTTLCRQEPAVRELLGMSDNHAVAGVLAIGHPADRVTKLRRQSVEEFTAVDRLDGAPFTRPGS